jgi:hypothetical protein
MTAIEDGRTDQPALGFETQRIRPPDEAAAPPLMSEERLALYRDPHRFSTRPAPVRPPAHDSLRKPVQTASPDVRPDPVPDDLTDCAA